MLEEFRIPNSNKTVSVSIIDTTSRVVIEADKVFAKPHPNHKNLEVPNFSFLIKHSTHNYSMLFDLGLRKDFLNAAPVVSDILRSGQSHLSVEKDICEILTEGGIRLGTINAAVWSHWHIDHIGDPSLFDPRMKLIVGPGFKQNLLPAYPANEESMVLASDFEGRELEELDFTTKTSTNLTIGRFDAIDYFGDGSFYFLNAPGHAIGHIAALARVQSAPDSFILMAGDGCLHGAQIRPSPGLQLPCPVDSSVSVVDVKESHSLIISESDSLNRSRSYPFYTASKRGVSYDADWADNTAQYLQDADARDDVFVVFSHDRSLLDVVDFFPKTANDFVQKGWIQKCRWKFLDDFLPKT